MKPETLPADKIRISVQSDTVSIQLFCGDPYKAQVLYDHIIEHLDDGKGLTLYSTGLQEQK